MTLRALVRGLLLPGPMRLIGKQRVGPRSAATVSSPLAESAIYAKFLRCRPKWIRPGYRATWCRRSASASGRASANAATSIPPAAKPPVC